MSLPRFFLDEQVLSKETEKSFELLLDKDDSKHFRVLRLAPGEHIAVIDAECDYFECEIESVDPVPVVSISQHVADNAARPEVCLFQGLCKGEKMDEVIRHATELGVTSFVPLVCERSVVKLDAKKAASRVQRWKSIAKSAAMQSGQPAIPQVHMPAKIAEAVKIASEFTMILICWEEERMLSLHQAISSTLQETGVRPQDAKIAVVVGPEGGLSEREVEALRSSNERAFSITLGKSILRTETAGIVAPALVLYELGGLQ